MNYGSGGFGFVNNAPGAGTPGPPFDPTSANNGLSVDPVSGKIVLGNDVGSVLAALITTREIPNLGNTRSTIFFTNGNIRLGLPGSADQTERLQVIGRLRVNTFVQSSFLDNFFLNQTTVPPGLTGAATGNYGLGAGTLALLTSGTRNIAIGRNNLPILTTGVTNIAIGDDSQTLSQNGSGNISLGDNVLTVLTTGQDNIQIGRNTAGVGISTGNQNTIIGVQANITGNLKTAVRNILIGYSVDAPSDTSGFINIGNIIYATGAVGINTNSFGSVGIGQIAPQQKLHVAGYGRFDGDAVGALIANAESLNLHIFDSTGATNIASFGRDTATAGLIIESYTAGITITPKAGTDITIPNGLIRFPGTTANTLRWGATTAAPATTATPVFTNYYGGNTNALGDPVAWILVNIAGTDRKIPVY